MERYAIDVRSIGRAGPEVHHALKHVMKLPHQAIVARLYQAPSELLTGLEHDTAHQIADVLGETGLDVTVRPVSEAVIPGRPDFDVAVHLKDPSKLPAVAQEIAGFLGCELPKAAQLVWASPALVVGSVSEATVSALRERLEPLGVELDLSKIDEALYDLYIQDCAPALRRRAEELVQREGLEALTEGPLLAVGCSKASTERLWRTFQASSMPVSVLCRDVQRFDLRLESITNDTPALRDLIVEVSGMPERLVPKVLGRLPMVLAQGVHARDVPVWLGRFADLGAKLSAHLLAYRSFDLVIARCEDPSRTARIASELLQQDEDGLRKALLQLPVTLPGPFSQVRARWMQHELAQTGARVRLNER